MIRSEDILYASLLPEIPKGTIIIHEGDSLLVLQNDPGKKLIKVRKLSMLRQAVQQNAGAEMLDLEQTIPYNTFADRHDHYYLPHTVHWIDAICCLVIEQIL